MKSYTKIFGKLFVQIWLLLLSLLIVIAGILMLTDLKYYSCVITEGRGQGCYIGVDDEGNQYATVRIDCKVDFYYTRRFHNLAVEVSQRVKSDIGYKTNYGAIYLDIYENKNGELFLIDTVRANSYFKRFYDLEYARSLEIRPRLESVKITFPAWRIYVPILLFLLSVPVTGLTTYNIVIQIFMRRKEKKESETPIDDV